MLLRRNYATEITQKLRKLHHHYANTLRRYYANKLRKSLRRLRKYYANHYANTTTQFPKISLRILRKYQFLLRRNSGHYAMGNLLMRGRRTAPGRRLSVGGQVRVTAKRAVAGLIFRMPFRGPGRRSSFTVSTDPSCHASSLVLIGNGLTVGPESVQY